MSAWSHLQVPAMCPWVPQPCTIAQLGAAAWTEHGFILWLRNMNKTENNGLSLVFMCSTENPESLHWQRRTFSGYLTFEQGQNFIWSSCTSHANSGKCKVIGIVLSPLLMLGWAHSMLQYVRFTTRSLFGEFSSVPAAHNVPGQLLFSAHLSLQN